MEEKENRVKNRRSIPILSKKHFFGAKSDRSANKNSQQQQVRDRKRTTYVPSLASSQTSFAAGLRGNSSQPTKSVKGAKCVSGSQTPGGWKWKAKFLKVKTPKSILKHKTPNASKTTGHKGKPLQDKTNSNTEGNKRHISLKLDFRSGQFQSNSESDNKIRAENQLSRPSLPSDSADVLEGLTKPTDYMPEVELNNIKEVVENECSNVLHDEQLSMNGNDISLLSDIQSLSLDNSDEVLSVSGSKEIENPNTSTPPEMVSSNIPGPTYNSTSSMSRADSSSHCAAKVSLKQQTSKKGRVGQVEVGRPFTEKKKTVVRSASFTNGGLAKRNMKSANGCESSKKLSGFNRNDRGIRRYSDLKRSEEELLKKNAELEAKLMESSMRIHNLETTLSELRGKVDETDHENFELREEMESKEKYFSETMERKEQIFMNENERLKERIDKCIERLLEAKIDPVTLEFLELKQAQKEDIIRARLEAKVQCKIFEQKLDAFTKSCEERFNDLTSNEYYDVPLQKRKFKVEEKLGFGGNEQGSSDMLPDSLEIGDEVVSLNDTDHLEDPLQMGNVGLVIVE